MKTLIAILTLAAAIQANADGFICVSDEGLKVKAFNRIQPEEGTRNAAVMILSDETVMSGRKTIARFTAANETLDNRGASYEAKVDLRYNDSGRQGEVIAGTKLGQLKTVLLDVAFSYARPVPAGHELEGLLTLVKRNGDIVEVPVTCERYLKQE